MDALTGGNNEFENTLKYLLPFYASQANNIAYKASATDKSPAAERFYDDNQWMALALIDAYKRSNNKTYLKTAKSIYKFLLNGFDTIGGGGMYWKENDFTTKNTCSNGPMIINILILLCLFINGQIKIFALQMPCFTTTSAYPQKKLTKGYMLTIVVPCWKVICCCITLQNKKNIWQKPV
jgi:Glycosyl hydrolase family 76